VGSRSSGNNLGFMRGSRHLGVDRRGFSGWCSLVEVRRLMNQRFPRVVAHQVASAISLTEVPRDFLRSARGVPFGRPFGHISGSCKSVEVREVDTSELH
jgi:hypothetical protein